MKNSKKVLLTLLLCVLCIASGYATGHSFASKSNKAEVMTTSNITNDSIGTTTGQKDENEYPFNSYQSFLTNSSGKIIDELNNNPIDKIFYKKYSNAKSPAQEQNVLADWVKAYENEFENAKSIFEDIVKQASNTGSDISSSELISVMEDYYENSLNYTESTAQLAYDFEEFNLGKGTGHTYDLLLNHLELNRINTLRLIECVYLLDGDYNWKIDK